MTRYITWIDLETTGLSIQQCLMLEFALVVTDEDLNHITSFTTPVNPTDENILENDHPAWQENAYEMHEASGLLHELRIRLGGEAQEFPVPSIAEVEQQACELIDNLQTDEKPVLAGASVHFDRLFLQRDMPQLHDRLHYRNLDVSTAARMADMWGEGRVEKSRPHRALEDILECIQEMKYYKEKYFDQ